MITLSNNLQVADNEIDIQAIHAQGKGGQNVNKVATAIHLRFNIQESSLPDHLKQRLLALSDQRINKDGIIVIKAQSYRTQEKNREDALLRLTDLIDSIVATAKKRRKTKPSKSSQRRRMDKKTKHSRKKVLRGKVTE
jgi:ribosome-associated protein